MRLSTKALLTSAALCLLAAPAANAASPSVVTLSATSIKQTSATLRGDVNPRGLATTYQFQYGRTTAYGSATSHHSAGSGTTTKLVSVSIGHLTPGTTYHFRILATNADGTTVGGDRTLRTALPPAKPPLVLGTAPFAPTATSVAFTALLNPRGATTTYRFQYGLTTAYGSETFAKSISAGVLPRSVSFHVNGLASHATYHFRVVASNRAGTTFGPDTLALTGPFPPGALKVVTRPHRQRRSHPVFVTKGHLVLGSGVSVALGCGSGRVTVSFTVGHRTVGRAHTDLRPGHCSFRLRMRVSPPPGAHRLRVHVRFGGNAILTPFSARSYLVRIG
jgi:hypothetical protein